MRKLQVLLLIFAFSFACTDDTGVVTNNSDRINPDKEIPEGAHLEHTIPCAANQPVCALDLSFGSAVPLRVKLVGSDGNPITSAAINYTINDSSNTGSSLSAAQSGTSAEGTAETELRSGMQGGTVEVIVKVGGNTTGVQPIKFVIAINAKGRSSYKISFNHIGNADIKELTVRAFPSTVTCAQVLADHEKETTPGVNPTLTAVTQAQGTAAADGTLPIIVIPEIPNGTAYTIEARGKSRVNPNVEASFEAAFGCKDGNPPIENGQSQDILVDLKDNLPQIAGIYNMNHTFSIEGAVCPQGGNGVIPEGVCTAIKLIGRLATDPASFFIGEDRAGDTGVLGLIVDFLPEGSLKETITNFLDNGIVKNTLKTKLNEFFKEWIDNKAPAWVKGAVNITADIYETLKEFRVSGSMRIRWEPVVGLDGQSGEIVGSLEKHGTEFPGEQLWSDITVFWAGDCQQGAGFEACRAKTFGSNDLNAGKVVKGDFTGSVVPMPTGGYALQIDQHTLTLNYGVLILGILEKIILPSVFDDLSVTSIDKAIEKIIGSLVNPTNTETVCKAAAVKINTAISVVEALCNALITKASDGITKYFETKLTVDGSDNLLIGTPAGKACKIIEPDPYGADWMRKPLPLGEAFGKVDMQCDWDLKIKVSSTKTINAPSTFFGSRK